IEIDAAGQVFTPDFPRIGYNADGLFVTTNSVSLATGFVDHGLLTTFRKSTLLDADNTTLRFFPTVLTPDDYTLVPACMHQAPAGAPMMFVGTIGGGFITPIPSQVIQYVTMTNYFSITPTITRNRITVANFTHGLTPNADQPFVAVTPVLLSTFDSSLLEAGWRDGHLVACGNVNIKGTTKVRWY